MHCFASGSSLPAGRTVRPHSVVALHCSGADGRQWRRLRATLDAAHDLWTPDLYGCESVGPWPGVHAFSLADEARPIIEIIDAIGTRVHLVGHSYGGGVALRVALERPEAIASLSLYEPSAFHLLRQMGTRGGPEFEEIRALAHDVASGVVHGAYEPAARRFVDYWNGPGSWGALKSEIRMGLLRWLPKAPLDFHALIEEPTPAADYAALDMPVLVLRGEHAPRPSRLITEELTRIMPRCRLEVVPGAGHMGPLTHGDDVAARIALHIRASKATPHPAGVPSMSNAA
jgi:pimeloyl-ACP methyl ester carboxylesterase